jgi:arylformamidase
MTRFVELGHRLDEGLSVSAHFLTRIAGNAGDTFQGGRAADVSAVPLAALAGLPGLVVDAPVPPWAVALELPESSAQDGAILVRTGWEKRWGTEGYGQAAPYLGPEAIHGRVRCGAALVGLDFCAVAAGHSSSGVARLLRAGVLVIENLCNLSALPADGFRFFAVPVAIAGGERFEVRAFAELLPR